jgi:hypothetical protein
MTDKMLGAEKPKATRTRSTANKSNKEAMLDRGAEFNVNFGDRSRPRQSVENDDLNLSIPAGAIPVGMVGEWKLDNGRGSIDKYVADYWGFVTDKSGVNMQRASGGGRTYYLMAIEKSYYDESEQLRMQRYYASIGEDADKSLDVKGVEAYTPNGVANKIKVTTDIFSS